MKLIYKIGIGFLAVSALSSFLPNNKTETAKAPDVEQVAAMPAAPAVTEDMLRTAFIDRCRGELKAQLTDPDSYREIGAVGQRHQVGDGYLVAIKYSATNAFGGRIQEHHTCNYVKA